MSNWYEAWADRYAEGSAGVTADVPFYARLPVRLMGYWSSLRLVTGVLRSRLLRQRAGVCSGSTLLLERIRLRPSDRIRHRRPARRRTVAAHDPLQRQR